MHINYIQIRNYKGIEELQIDLPVCNSGGVNIQNLFLCGASGIGKTSFLQAVSLCLRKNHRAYIENYIEDISAFDSMVSVRYGDIDHLYNVLAYSFDRVLEKEPVRNNLLPPPPKGNKIRHIFEGRKAKMFDVFEYLNALYGICVSNDINRLKEEAVPFKSIELLKEFHDKVRLSISMCIRGDIYDKIPYISQQWQTNLDNIENKLSKSEYDCLVIVSDIFYKLMLWSKRGIWAKFAQIDPDFQTQKNVVLIDNINSFMDNGTIKVLIEGLNSCFPNTQFIFSFNGSNVPKIKGYENCMYLSIDKRNPFLSYGTDYYNALQQ